MRSLVTVLAAGLVLTSTVSRASIPPTVAITSPASGASLGGMVSIQAEATAEQGVARVDFFVNGRLQGSDTTAPFSTDWDSGLEANGSYTLTAMAFDVENNAASSALVTVSVDQPGRATFEPALQVPACVTLGAGCDTMNLVKGWGRGERNAPNTLDGCADAMGTAPAYPQFIDRIQVSRINGEHLAEGRRARIDVHISQYTYIDVDLFYATDATQPVWTYLTTLDANAAGNRILSTEYVLPSGELQAVRALLHKETARVACSINNYEADHDDVVFAVGQPTDTLPPLVAVTSPSNNAWVSGMVSLAATADDDLGVERVEFHIDGALVGTDTSAPYEVSWNSAAVPSGAHTLTARAYDSSGHVGISAEHVVNTDITPPSLTWQFPGEFSSVRGTVTLQVEATDNRRVSRVEFYNGTTFIGSSSAKPYATSWHTSQLAEGPYTLTAKAYDPQGNTASADTLVTVDNTAPTVTISAPSHVRGTVELTATASDNQRVLFVEFYVGATLLGRDSAAPYSMSWDTTSRAEGLTSVRARAYDPARSFTDADRHVTVDHTPPTVEITSPANGASLFLSTTVAASAGDNTDISKVVFYDGAKVIGTDTTYPHSVSWNLLGVTKGWHTLTAKAYDLSGHETTSQAITVKVN